jgi:hypothetical protein
MMLLRSVAAIKARVSRLELVISNVSLAKLIDRIMQVTRARACSVCGLCITEHEHAAGFHFAPSDDSSRSLYPTPEQCLLQNTSSCNGSKLLSKYRSASPCARDSQPPVLKFSFQRAYHRRNARLGWSSLMVT